MLRSSFLVLSKKVAIAWANAQWIAASAAAAPPASVSGRSRSSGPAPRGGGEPPNISPTWYTWLEQGRGGAPSVDVLDRIAKGRMLTEPAREHL